MVMAPCLYRRPNGVQTIPVYSRSRRIRRWVGPAWPVTDTRWTRSRSGSSPESLHSRSHRSATLTLTRWNIAGCLRQLSVSLLARWSAGSDCADAWQHGILGSVSSSWKWGWLAAGRSTARSTSRQRRWCGRRRLNQAVFGSTSAPRLLRGRWSSARKIWRT